MHARTVGGLAWLALTSVGLCAQDDRPYLAIRCRAAALAETFGSWTPELERADASEGPFTVFAAGGSPASVDWAGDRDDLLAEVRIEPGRLRDGLCDDLGIAAGLLRGSFCTGAIQGGAPARYCAQVFAAVWRFPEQIDHIRFLVTDTGNGDRHVAGTIVPRPGSRLEDWLAAVEVDPRGTLWLRDPAATLWLGTALRGPSIQQAWQGWWEHLATFRGRQLRGTGAAIVAEAVGLASALRDGRIALQWSTQDRSVFAVGTPDPQALAELEQTAGFRALAQARLGAGPRSWQPDRIGDDQPVVRVQDDALPTDRALFRTVRGDYLLEAVDEPSGPAAGKLLRRLAAGRARSVPLPDGQWLQAEFRRPPLAELQRLEFPFPLPVELEIDDLATSVHAVLPERATLAIRRATPGHQTLQFEMELYGLGADRR